MASDQSWGWPILVAGRPAECARQFRAGAHHATHNFAQRVLAVGIRRDPAVEIQRVVQLHRENTAMLDQRMTIIREIVILPFFRLEIGHCFCGPGVHFFDPSSALGWLFRGGGGGGFAALAA